MIPEDLDCGDKNQEGSDSFDVNRIEFPRAEPGSYLSSDEDGNEQGTNKLPGDFRAAAELSGQPADGIHQNE